MDNPSASRIASSSRLRRFPWAGRGIAFAWIVLGVVLASGCGREAKEPTRPVPVSIRFTEVAREQGLLFESIQSDGVLDYVSETVGTGIAWLDYDNDGDWDLYAVNGEGHPNALFRNDGGRFTDVAAEAGVADMGWDMGVAAADFDGDGWVDLFVTRFGGPDLLFRNRGDGTFQDVTDAAGVGGDPAAWSTSSAWADVDGDGDLDLYVARYIDFSDPGAGAIFQPTYRNEAPTLIPDPYPAQGNALYQNNGDGTFTDATDTAGVRNAEGKGLGVVFGDFDNDGDLDLYVANDVTPNVLYRNRGDGTFENVSFQFGVDDARNSMGVDFGDFDNDGDLDIFSTNWQTQTNVLYRNGLVRRDGKPLSEGFDDVTLDAGLGAPSLGLTGWGAQFADFDNDGDLDLFVTNGYTSPSPTDPSRYVGQRAQVLRNDGGRFTDLPDAFAFEEWGSGRGTAIADVDGDGDMDVAVSQNNGRLLFFRNDTERANAWITVQAPPGARIMMRVGSQTSIREVRAGSSFLSSSAPEAHFGVPWATEADRIEVRFPDGTTQRVDRVPVRSRVLFRRNEPPTVQAEQR